MQDMPIGEFCLSANVQVVNSGGLIGAAQMQSQLSVESLIRSRCGGCDVSVRICK